MFSAILRSNISSATQHRSRHPLKYISDKNCLRHTRLLIRIAHVTCDVVLLQRPWFLYKTSSLFYVVYIYNLETTNIGINVEILIWCTWNPFEGQERKKWPICK